MTEATAHISEDGSPGAAAAAEEQTLYATGEVRSITGVTRPARIRDIWRTLPLGAILAIREFKANYKQSVIGPLWLLAQPLGILGAFTIVFNGITEVNTDGVPYTLFALVGITVWTFISGALAVGPKVFLKAKQLIGLLSSPKSVYVNASVFSLVPNMAAPMLLTGVALIAFGQGVSWRLLLLPACVLWLVALLWFLMLVLGSLNVWIRDIASIVPFLLQGGVFLTPVGYPVSDAPQALQAFLLINPFTGIVDAWRWCVLGSSFDTRLLLIGAAWAIVIPAISWQIFTRLEGRFADVI